MVRHLAGMERREMGGGLWWGNLDESDDVEGGRLHWKAVYKIISLRKGQMAVLFEMTMNFGVSINCG
jgi:hypothetical protein